MNALYRRPVSLPGRQAIGPAKKLSILLPCGYEREKIPAQ